MQINNNIEIRVAVLKAGLMLWEVADAMGICDSALSRILRRELPKEKKDEILFVIQELSSKRV